MDALKLLVLVTVCVKSLCEAAPLPKDGKRQITTRARPAVHVENMTLSLGPNALVHCQAPANVTVLAVKWIRTDLKKKYVVYWRDGHMDPGNQHPSFKDRTKMQASQIDHGDLSVALNNVRSTDNGTYEAYMKIRRNSRVETDLICIVNLMTAPRSDASAGDKKTGDKKTGNKKTGDNLPALSVIGVNTIGDHLSRNRYGYLGFLVLILFVQVIIFVVRKYRKQSDRTASYHAAGTDDDSISNGAHL